jgi:hypothetical protein
VVLSLTDGGETGDEGNGQLVEQHGVKWVDVWDISFES